MAGEELADLRAWCKRQREYLQMQREMLRSGTFQIVRQDGSSPIDESKQSIDRITNNIAELDLILAEHDKRLPNA
jgi:predicted translin family RNA/ssDNA-binding protein